MNSYQKLPAKLELIRVNVRYVCQVCNRVYKKTKMDAKFHEIKKHGVGLEMKPPVFEQRVTINGMNVDCFDPRDLVTLRKKGILKPPPDLAEKLADVG
jgi:hypothetical protein